MDTEPKKRKSNFSSAETVNLLEEYMVYKDVLIAKFSAKVTHATKNHAWLQITHHVNKVSKTIRTVAEVKKKFMDLRTSVKKKRAEEVKYRRGTGNICLQTFDD